MKRVVMARRTGRVGRDRRRSVRWQVMIRSTADRHGRRGHPTLYTPLKTRIHVSSCSIVTLLSLSERRRSRARRSTLLTDACPRDRPCHRRSARIRHSRSSPESQGRRMRRSVLTVIRPTDPDGFERDSRLSCIRTDEGRRRQRMTSSREIKLGRLAQSVPRFLCFRLTLRVRSGRLIALPRLS